MKKQILILSTLALSMGSCMDIVDTYYGEPYDPSKKDTLIVDDKGIVWSEVADYGTSKLIERFWKVNGTNFESSSPEFHFTHGADGKQDPNNNYWHQAHAMDVIVDAYLRAKAAGNSADMATYNAIFENGYKTPMGDGSSRTDQGVLWTNFGGDQYRGHSPVFGNQFVDDMEWHAITLVRIYNATGEAVYLHEAQRLFAQIMTAWNIPVGMAGDGGLCWNLDENPKSKNACSNGPGVVAGMMLYAASQGTDYAVNSLADYADYDYLTDSKMIYNWLKAVLFNKETGAVYDMVKQETINYGTLTYNQGTFLGGAHMLYQATGDMNYLNDAKLAANYSMSNHANSNILKDEGAGGDMSIFKGILVRYLAGMVNDPKVDRAYRCTVYDFLRYNAVALWNGGMDRNESGEVISLFTPDWTTPESTIFLKGNDYMLPLLGWQVSGATLMEAVVAMENPRK